MLSIPMRGDGTIDEKERAIVEGIGAWMAVNSEAIYGTRPGRYSEKGRRLYPQQRKAPGISTKEKEKP